MKLPISARLLACADLVSSCETVADVGSDHGYLGVHLLLHNVCSHVIASDLREKPLANAKENALRFEAADRMTFLRADGFRGFEPGSFQTAVLAGMGGDLIARILGDAPWLCSFAYTLVLQPQSAANDLRRWLGENGWSIERERLVRDGGFLYSVMRVVFGDDRVLTPGEQYVSPALRREGDPLFPDYLDRVSRALEQTVSGISQSADPADLARASYFRSALDEIRILTEKEKKR